MRCWIFAASPNHELAVVVPVYNEETDLGRVLTLWWDITDGLVNRTAEALQGLTEGDRVQMAHQCYVGCDSAVLNGDHTVFKGGWDEEYPGRVRQ